MTTSVTYLAYNRPMATYEIQGRICIDTDLEDGFVRVEGSWPQFFMSLDTYYALAGQTGMLGRCTEALERVRGLHLIPRAVIEPEAASELRLGLSMVEAEPSEYCAFQPCVLPATVDRPEGFSLCDHHDSLMRGWDDLVA